MRAQLVRNNQLGPTVFHDDASRLKPVIWQGRGDPGGGDIKPVPQELFDSVQFQIQLTCGVFELIDNQQEVNRIEQVKREQFKQAAFDRMTASNNVLETPAETDIVIRECIGANGVRKCTTQVQLRASQLHSEPPLCPRHSRLRGTFMPQGTDRIVNGRPEVVWVRASATVTAPEKAPEGQG